jgi:5-methylcytosine-specific restriction endonuclease McrA
MIKYSNLERLRQHGINPPCCPKCEGVLTIEETEFFRTEICEHCLDYSKIDAVGECCKNRDAEYVRMITAGGTTQVKMQCRNCGKVSGQAIGGFTAAQKSAMPLLDQERRDKNEEMRSIVTHNYYNKLRELREQKFIKQKQEWFAEYNKYLESPQWKRKREEVLKRDKYLCQACLDAYATQVHHKSYEFVDLQGNEPAFDLVAICVPCHNRIERMKKQR